MDHDLSRRALLAGGAGAGLAGLLAACTDDKAAPTGSPSSSPATSAPSGPTSWSELAAATSGALLRSGSNGWDAARVLRDPRYDDADPQGILRVASSADVVAGLAFVRNTRTPVALRSGGHSYNRLVGRGRSGHRCAAVARDQHRGARLDHGRRRLRHDRARGDAARRVRAARLSRPGDRRRVVRDGRDRGAHARRRPRRAGALLRPHLRPADRRDARHGGRPRAHGLGERRARPVLGVPGRRRRDARRRHVADVPHAAGAGRPDVRGGLPLGRCGEGRGRVAALGADRGPEAVVLAQAARRLRPSLRPPRRGDRHLDRPEVGRGRLRRRIRP